MDVLEHESTAETALLGRTGNSLAVVAQKPPLSLVRNRNPLSVQLVPVATAKSVPETTAELHGC